MSKFLLAEVIFLVQIRAAFSVLRTRSCWRQSFNF